MWWTIIPPTTVVLIFLGLPIGFNYVSNKLFLGCGYFRKMNTHQDYQAYLRDERLSGSPYKHIGLSELGDCPEDCECP